MLAFLVLGLFTSGCGGSSRSSDSSAESSAKTNVTSAKQSKSDASAESGRKAKQAIADFGAEASTEELEAASAVLANSFRARQAADFATQCATLSANIIKQIPGVPKTGNLERACPGALKKAATPLSQTAAARKDTMSGPIYALRVKGNVAQALFHGKDGKDYSIVLEREDGTWKVGALVATEL